MSEFTSGTVDVPAVGRMKKVYIAVPAVAAVGYLGYRWYRAKQDAAATPTDSSGLYTTPDQTETGLSTTGGATDITGNTGNQVTNATDPNAVNDNAQWTQRAVELLGNAGYDSTTVYGALGDFLARRSLDKTEASIARAALAAVGQPPVGGPYSVLDQATTGGTGTLAAPAHLRLRGHAPTQLKLQWDPVPGASHYRIYRTDLDQGEPVGDSLDTMYNANGLTPNTSYSFFVRAMGADGKTGDKSNVLTARTDQVKLAVPAAPHASAITRTSFRATTNKVSGATYYRWYLNGQAHGASDNPYYDFTGLHPRTKYRVTVAADTTTGPPTVPSRDLFVTTKR